MVGKGLNLFAECATKCVNLSSQEEVHLFFLNGPTKINKNGAIGKVRNLVEELIL